MQSSLHLLRGFRRKTEASLAYERQIIEALSRSEKQATLKYQSLQQLIQQSQVQVEDSRDPSLPPPYQTEISKIQTSSLQASDNETRYSKPVIGELILCFKLIHNLLSKYIDNAGSATHYRIYSQLRGAVETAQTAELEWMEATYGEVTFKIGAKAAQHALLLQRSLHQLAEELHEKSRTHTEVAVPGPGKAVSSRQDPVETGPAKPDMNKLRKELPSHLTLSPLPDIRSATEEFVDISAEQAPNPPQQIPEKPPRKELPRKASSPTRRLIGIIALVGKPLLDSQKVYVEVP
jgi:hypothetical protein